MLQIKTTPYRNLNKISLNHYDMVKDHILNNLHGLSARQRDFIRKRLKEIITAKPNKLIKLHKEYLLECKKPGKGQLKNPNSNLSSVINYGWFSKKETVPYNGYDLARKLQVNTCPYCNRNYTVTVGAGKKGIVRPDFDHFLAKNEYPLLALSFYNLIPSCQICNRSVKNKYKVVYGKVMHPYEEGFEDKFNFNFTPGDADSSLGLSLNFSLQLKANPLHPKLAALAAKNAALFKLDDIYQESHRGEVADIIRKHHVSGGLYLETLKASFPQLGTIEDLYRIAFGAYYNLEDFEKRPLSKLTKDIVEQLSFVYPKLP